MTLLVGLCFAPLLTIISLETGRLKTEGLILKEGKNRDFCPEGLENGLHSQVNVHTLMHTLQYILLFVLIK